MLRMREDNTNNNKSLTASKALSWSRAKIEHGGQKAFAVILGIRTFQTDLLGRPLKS